MAECLLSLMNHSAPRSEYGSFIDIREDGYGWKRLEKPPDFAVVKIPEIPILSIKKYIDSHLGENGECIRERKWVVRISAMSAIVRDRILSGLIIVKSSLYNGASDIPWSTFKNFIRNMETGFDETMVL